MLVKSEITGLKVVPATTNNDATAAGSGDDTEVTGEKIIKTGFDSALLTIAGITSLTADKTLSFKVDIQDSADGSTWNTATTLKASTAVLTGAKTDADFTVPLDVDISGYDEYIRFNITPDLSHTSTDTVNWGAVAVLGNDADNPQDHSFSATEAAA